MAKTMDSEKTVESYLREQMKALGGRTYKWVSPGNVGVPDRICIFPGGRVVFVELKGPGGRVSAAQRLQIDRLLALGCAVYVAWSRDDVDWIIGEVLGCGSETR